MERIIETLLLRARWLLVPLYLGLMLAVLAAYGEVGTELWHLATTFAVIDETELVLALLSILDLVLIANLVMIVAITSYENFVSRIDTVEGQTTPDGLARTDNSGVKLKVSLSIVMISAIHLLRAFMRDTSTERMIVLGGIHLVFVVSALLIAYINRLEHARH